MKRSYTNKTIWNIHKIVQIIFWVVMILSNIIIIKKRLLAETLPGIDEVVEYIEVDSRGETATPEEVENNDDYQEPSRSSYTGYEGSISSTYSEYFKGVLYKENPKHYVICRTGQYQYLMAYGDNLSYSNGTFSGSVKTIIINTNTYNANFTITYGTDSNFIFSVNNNMIYSDLGSFPVINYQTSQYYQKGVIYFASAIILTIGFYWITKSFVSRTIKFY